DPHHLSNRFFYFPTIFSPSTSHIRILQQQLFPPLFTIESFPTHQQLIHLPNHTIYPLPPALCSTHITNPQTLPPQLT
ncbi:aldehyde dehydrogenase family protein, partial [Bacillus pumilus]|uniref:aldehyde dehydrogenase family protein n=1 Tax=Bacillus pumilus TaxID=1408 RepID=UPI0011A97ABC